MRCSAPLRMTTANGGQKTALAITWRREDADSADSTRGTMLPNGHWYNAPGDTASRSHRHAETLSLPQTFPARGNHTPGKSSPPAQAFACRGHIWLLIAHSPVESCTHL